MLDTHSKNYSDIFIKSLLMGQSGPVKDTAYLLGFDWWNYIWWTELVVCLESECLCLSFFTIPYRMNK